jgi:hypothetical protein
MNGSRIIIVILLLATSLRGGYSYAQESDQAQLLENCVLDWKNHSLLAISGDNVSKINFPTLKKYPKFPSKSKSIPVQNISWLFSLETPFKMAVGQTAEKSTEPIKYVIKGIQKKVVFNAKLNAAGCVTRSSDIKEHQVLWENPAIIITLKNTANEKSTLKMDSIILKGNFRRNDAFVFNENFKSQLQQKIKTVLSELLQTH